LTDLRFRIMILGSPVRRDGPGRAPKSGSRYAARTTKNPVPARKNAVERDIGRDDLGPSRRAAHQKAKPEPTVMNRTATTSVAGRSSAMRRLRRRSHAAAATLRPYCGTNGCTSFLEVDPQTGLGQCPICGYQRRLH
jgi:hypothetical protein